MITVFVAKEAKRMIPTIRCARKGVVTSTEESIETIYQDLYTGGPTPSENDFSNFFSGLELPTLTVENM